MVVWKPDWKKPVCGQKCPVCEWSVKSRYFTIWIPSPSVRYSNAYGIQCPVFRWLLYFFPGNWLDTQTLTPVTRWPNSISSDVLRWVTFSKVTAAASTQSISTTGEVFSLPARMISRSSSGTGRKGRKLTLSNRVTLKTFFNQSFYHFQVLLLADGFTQKSLRWHNLLCFYYWHDSCSYNY